MIRTNDTSPVGQDAAAAPTMSCSPSPDQTSSSSLTNTTSPSSASEETDLMEILYDKEPKSTDLRISCTICGDRASGFHYGVHACEGCKGFFRRTVRMRLKYKECQIGCKVNVKSRNKCQYCRFQKCLNSGMSHDAIRFGRMSRVEKNRIITKMAKEEPALLDRKRIEAEQAHLKKLSETILNAFHKHFSMTRAKMTALWRERGLPGVSAPILDSLEDVKVLYPQLFASKFGDRNDAKETQQFTATGSLPNAGENSQGLLLPDDISFSSASSDSGSDELLSAVKKIAIPYPQYENMNTTPDLSNVYSQMQGLKDGTYLSEPSWSGQERDDAAYHDPLSYGRNISGPGSNFNNRLCEASEKAAYVEHYGGQQNSSSGWDASEGTEETQNESDMDSILYTELKGLFEPHGEDEKAVKILKKIEVACQNKMDVDQLFKEFPGFKNFFERLNLTSDYLKKFIANFPTYGVHSFMECARQARMQKLLEEKLKSGDASASGGSQIREAQPGEKSEMTKLLEKNTGIKSIGTQIVKFLYQNMQKRLVKGVCELTEFSKNIPGFGELTLSDQVILLKYGSYEALFVMLGAMIFKKGMLLPEGNVYVTFDFVNKLGDIGLVMKPKFEFAEKIASMNLQDEELSLFAASIILFGDRPGLNEREKVEKIQSEILRALEMQLKISHPNDPQLFARLLLKMTDLRQLVADHVTMVERLIKIHSIRKLFHPLITEIIKDRE